MADYHHVYEAAEKEETEWDAIQRKLGNLPPKPKSKKPPKFTPEKEQQKDLSLLQKCDEAELDDLEDDLDDDPFLEEYRRRRLAELRQIKPTEFGSLIEIKGSDFIREVTDASESSWVVVLLYQPGHPKCVELDRCLAALAADFPLTKFTKALSEECIPGYPRENLPTVLVYHKRSCKRNLIGLEPYRSVDEESVAETLNSIGPVCASE